MTDLFTRYVSMGPSRSLGELAKQTGIGIAQLVDISTREKWHERCSEIDKKAAKLYEDDAALTVAAVTRTQLAIAAELQEKALLALRTLNFTRAEHVIQALKLSIEVQRKALFLDEQSVSAEERVADLLMQRLQKTSVKQIEAKPFVYDPNMQIPTDPNEAAPSDTQVPTPPPEPSPEPSESQWAGEEP